MNQKSMEPKTILADSWEISHVFFLFLHYLR